ncbi:MAG: hypothetical protein ACREML_00335 [Vulcanimicrobiaceae bacterium]
MASRRVLFVTNGHGEVAIAARIAAEVHRLAEVATDHLALVGADFAEGELVMVGPRRSMPSGGLVAMGNLGAFARDVLAGFIPFWLEGVRYVRRARGRYACVVSVGDVYCLWMALGARTRTIFVGTAKSAYVAPYGPLECRIMRRAQRVFVRDSATQRIVRDCGVAAEAPGNVITDLAQSEQRFPWQGDPRIVVLPGSRASAYANAATIGAALRVMATRRSIDVAVSIAPGIEEQRLLDALGVTARSWDGPLGALFCGATLALGQAGTANEAAAAAGVPVVALADGARKEDWYRMRQRKLLDGALAIVPSDAQLAAHEILALIDDPARRGEMAACGHERMGDPGGAVAIARAILAA